MSDEQRIHAGRHGDDYVDVEKYNDEIHLTINQPYAGDTATGLHRTANVTLTPEQAQKLVIALIERLL